MATSGTDIFDAGRNAHNIINSDPAIGLGLVRTVVVNGKMRVHEEDKKGIMDSLASKVGIKGIFNVKDVVFDFCGNTPERSFREVAEMEYTPRPQPQGLAPVNVKNVYIERVDNPLVVHPIGIGTKMWLEDTTMSVGDFGRNGLGWDKMASFANYIPGMKGAIKNSVAEYFFKPMAKDGPTGAPSLTLQEQHKEARAKLRDGTTLIPLDHSAAAGSGVINSIEADNDMTTARTKKFPTIIPISVGGIQVINDEAAAELRKRGIQHYALAQCGVPAIRGPWGAARALMPNSKLISDDKIQRERDASTCKPAGDVYTNKDAPPGIKSHMLAEYYAYKPGQFVNDKGESFDKVMARLSVKK